jgi:hypothetical protein
MASPAQITANQLNAQHSTGPQTEEGKAAVSANATKHGLTAAFTVLAHEDQDQFDQIQTVLRNDHQPENIHQNFLVNQMMKAQWQLARAERLETVAFELLAMPAPDSGDPDIRIVNAILASGRDALGAFKRYAAQAERSYYKAYREFAAAKRIQNEAKLVAQMDANLARRIITAPLPDSPAYGSPYGHNAKSPLQNTPAAVEQRDRQPNPAPAAPAKPTTPTTPAPAAKPSATPATSAKPSLRSQYPENLALCL